MRKVLTDKALKAIKPAPKGKRVIVADAIVPGLGIRVTERGHKTYIFGARFGGPSSHFVRREIAEVGAVTLAAARTKAREWHELLRQGLDPAILRQQERQQREQERMDELREQQNSFLSVCESYFAHIKRAGHRKAADMEREIRNELVKPWAARSIADITSQDLVAVIDRIAARGATYQAHQIFGRARSLFSWAIARGVYGLEKSPCDRLRPKDLIGEKKSRQRVLTDAEVGAFWRATSTMGYPWGPLFQILLLTGQREGEWANARWSEIDLEERLFTVPSERYKTGSTHLVPLSDDVMALLEELPRFAGSDYLFTATSGELPVRGFTKPKLKLDALMMKELGEVPPFTVHDLRRTVRTRLSALRISDRVAEQILGHGAKGIQRVYDLHKFQEEMTEALDAWALRLRVIVEPQMSRNVVRLRK
jgi:integrase